MQNVLPTTLPQVLADAATRFGDRPAVVDGETRLSFAALQQEVNRATAGFLAAGIGRGDCVALWAPNGWRWIVACLAAQTAGAAVVPMNTRLKGAEAAYILNRTRARCLISAGTFLGTDYAALLQGEAVPALRHHVRFDTEWPEFADNGIEPETVLNTGRSVRADDISDILFTSGTTGHPKGVVTTHAQTVRVFRLWAECVGLRADDRYVIINPFFHSFGYKAGWLACLLTGATSYPMARFDTSEAAALVQRENITVLPGPPTIFTSFLEDEALRQDGWRQLKSLRLAVTGAASVTPSLITRMRDDLGISTVLTGYGLTESCGVVTMTQIDDAPETVARSCGRALPGVELRIAGPDGAPVCAGETGQILVRGFNVMQGYFDDNAATGAAVDAQGWLHTGDIGWLDARGYLHITDRLKDMYISGGFNCYPAEVERIMASHPDIARVAVVGVPDARLGEVGIAFVVVKAGKVIAAAALLEWARGAMANYKVPRAVLLADSLPLNAAGKVVKAELRHAAVNQD